MSPATEFSFPRYRLFVISPVQTSRHFSGTDFSSFLQYRLLVISPVQTSRHFPGTDFSSFCRYRLPVIPPVQTSRHFPGTDFTSFPRYRLLAMSPLIFHFPCLLHLKNRSLEITAGIFQRKGRINKLSGALRGHPAALPCPSNQIDEVFGEHHPPPPAPPPPTHTNVCLDPTSQGGGAIHRQMISHV